MIYITLIILRLLWLDFFKFPQFFKIFNRNWKYWITFYQSLFNLSIWFLQTSKFLLFLNNFLIIWLNWFLFNLSKNQYIDRLQFLIFFMSATTSRIALISNRFKKGMNSKRKKIIFHIIVILSLNQHFYSQLDFNLIFFQIHKFNISFEWASNYLLKNFFLFSF